MDWNKEDIRFRGEKVIFQDYRDGDIVKALRAPLKLAERVEHAEPLSAALAERLLNERAIAADIIEKLRAERVAPWNDPSVKWICEQHPEKEFPHDDCAGPGMVEDTPENRRKGYIHDPLYHRSLLEEMSVLQMAAAIEVEMGKADYLDRSEGQQRLLYFRALARAAFRAIPDFALRAKP